MEERPNPADTAKLYKRAVSESSKTMNRQRNAKLTPARRKEIATLASKAATVAMTLEQRTARAKLAAAARWRKAKATSFPPCPPS